MKKLFYSFSSFCTRMMRQATNPTALSVVSTTGGLSSAIANAGGYFDSSNISPIKNLTVTGTIDVRDFLIMSSYYSMPLLSVLDLSKATIAGYICPSYTTHSNTIPDAAFSKCSGLTSVTIPLSVTSIGDAAFYGCTGLTSVTIPSSVTSIGNGAFAGCSGLTSVTIPSSVTSIGGGTFLNCTSLTSITIPSSVTFIGEGAFAGCTSLTSVIIPSSVISIGNNTFASCSGLTSITIFSSVTSIGEGAFQSCIGLTSITLPSSVTSIGEDAFEGCTGLTSVTIPSSVTLIGDLAFHLCSGLTSITIPSSVTSIGNGAFDGCSGLTSIKIPSAVTSIGAKAFDSYTSFTVDTSNPNYSSIDGVLFNKNKTILIQCPISKTGSYLIPSSVTSIGWAAFMDCSVLTSVTIPSSVTSIGDIAFGDCTSLTSITIPSSVTSIGDSTFLACSGLTSITIPSSVTSIGKDVFEFCSALTSIYAYPTTPVDLTFSPYIFYYVNTTTCILYVPTNSINLYKSANQWSAFTNILPMSTTGISTEKVSPISVYPNPVTEGFYINGVESTATLTILDLNSKTLLTKQVTGNEYVSISSFPKGLYVVKISTNNGTIETKLIKN